MRVLVTDGGHKNTLCIIRHLSKIGHEVSILHHKKSAPAYSRYCKHLYLSPSIFEKTEYIDFVIQIIRDSKFDVLIPVGAESYSIFSQCKERITPYTKIEIAEPEKIQIALNKAHTYKFAERIGVDYPKTIYPNNLTDAIYLSESLVFPVVVKPPLETKKAFKVTYFETQQALAEGLPQIFSTLNQQIPIIQEKIEGDGYGFYAVYKQGVIQQAFMHQRIREYPVKGGISSCAKSIYNPELYQLGKKVLDELKWHGPAMVEFKREDKTGLFKLIEINPKFWGSLDLSMAAGINFPDLICKMAVQKSIIPKDYVTDISFQWLFAFGGEFYRLKEKPGDIWKVLKDLITKKCKNDFWLRDPLPNLKQLIDYLINLIGFTK